MMEAGLMKHCGNGTFYILPLLQRSVEKLTKILDRYMSEIDGQKVSLPILTPAELWKKSGRFEDAQAELMVIKDRHDKMLLLSPVSFETRIFEFQKFSLTISFVDSRRIDNFATCVDLTG